MHFLVGILAADSHLPMRISQVSVERSLEPQNRINQTSLVTIPIEEFTDLSLKENSGDSKDSTDDKGSSSSLAESSDDVQLLVSSALKPRRRLCKRKGLPCRAPMH